MTVKQDLLKILEANKGSDISGESIAKELGVSRTAVWKAVSSLRSEGFAIEAGTNKGYRLVDTRDILSEDGIRAFLPSDLSGFEIHVYDEIDSTNKEAARLNLGAPDNSSAKGRAAGNSSAKGRGLDSSTSKGIGAGSSSPKIGTPDSTLTAGTGAPGSTLAAGTGAPGSTLAAGTGAADDRMPAGTGAPGSTLAAETGAADDRMPAGTGAPGSTLAAGTGARLFVVADKQTAGRGRLGRQFYSPASGGLYMSLLFTPSDDVNEAVLTTVASSVAVSRAIRRVCGLHCGIKWVNDLYIEGKKVCGILTEAGTDFESGQITHLIVGIGINCHIQDFPEDIRDIAASLDQFEECRDFSSNELAAAVLTELCSILGDMSNRSFMEEYRRDSIVTGKDVKLIRTGREPVNAHVDGINDSGALMVTYLEGERSGESDVIASGEVSLRFHCSRESLPHP